MVKRVVFYDKRSIGHRPYIQGVIRDNLRPSDYIFQIVSDPAEENSLAFLRKLCQRERFDHCHMLTLGDCLEDFFDDEEVRWFREAKITFSGTLYLFTFLSPHIILTKDLWRDWHLKPYIMLRKFLFKPWYRKQVMALLKVMKSGLINTIALPDERLSQHWRYPLWRDKLLFLPDPAAYSNEPDGCQRAKLDFEWNPDIPTLLMFGSMRRYKGLGLLIEALSDKFSRSYCTPLRVVLAGRQLVSRSNVNLSHFVELIEYDYYIDPLFAKKLFAAADCVVMPYDKGFEYSVGAYSLACASGKFVIVPDQGVLGWRVRNFGNGITYRPGSAASLADAIAEFVEKYAYLSFPIKGSLKYAATCTPGRYVEILDSIIKESLDSVHYK